MMNGKRILALIVCALMLLTIIPTAIAEDHEAERQETEPTHERPAPFGRDEKPAPEQTRGTNTYLDEPLSLGSNDFVITAGGETVYRPFTPTEAGCYVFYSVTDRDTYGYLQDSDKNVIAYNDDFTDNDFCIRYELEAGETYYLGVRFYNTGNTGTIPVTVERHPLKSCGEDLLWSYDESSKTLSITGSGDMWDFSYNGVPWRNAAEEILSVELPDGLTRIGNYAFFATSDLHSIDIPEGVVSIGDQAFEYSGLTDVTLPESVRSVEQTAFFDCEQLETVSLPDGLEYIGAFAFAHSAVTSICIPKNVSEIECGAFSECCNLMPEAFTVDPGNTAFTADNGVLYWDRSGFITLHTYLSVKQNSMFTVNADRIYAYAFYHNPYIKNIILSDGIEDTEPYAFEDCSGLQSITIPTSLTTISYCTFEDCINLNSVYYLGTEETRNSTLYIEDWYNDSILNALWYYGEPFDGTVIWDPRDVQFKGSTAYVIANGSAQTPRFTVKDADGNDVARDQYYYRYLENTDAGTGYVMITFGDECRYAGFTVQYFKIYLPATTATTAANRSDGVCLTWSPVEGADGYVIYRRAWSSTTGGWTDFVRWNNTTELTWTDAAVYAGTRYQYGVKAYFDKRADGVTGAPIGGNVGDNFNLGMVGPLKTIVRITTRVLNSVTAGKKQMTVKWGASGLFTGYQIQYATNSAFTQNAKTVKITNAKTSQTVIKSLTSGKTYWVRLRSYHVFNGVTYYGDWSNVKSCKIK